METTIMGYMGICQNLCLPWVHDSGLIRGSTVNRDGTVSIAEEPCEESPCVPCSVLACLVWIW